MKTVNERFFLTVKRCESAWDCYKAGENFIIHTNCTDEANFGLFFIISNENPIFYIVYHGVYFKDYNDDFIFESSEEIGFENFHEVKHYILENLEFNESLLCIINHYYDVFVET